MSHRDKRQDNDPYPVYPHGDGRWCDGTPDMTITGPSIEALPMNVSYGYEYLRCTDNGGGIVDPSQPTGIPT